MKEVFYDFFKKISLLIVAFFVVLIVISKKETPNTSNSIIFERGPDPAVNIFSKLPYIDESATSTDTISKTSQIVKKITEKIQLGSKATENSSSSPAYKEEISKPQTHSIEELNELGRKATVNILCSTVFGGPLEPITGSGVIIDKKGIVLTNAHLAQFFLLKDFPEKDGIDCTIRMGSPAKPMYKAKLAYIPKIWIEENRKNITSDNPTGTGENDFAILYITDPIDKSTTRPEEFPFVKPNMIDMTEKSTASSAYVAVAYPAGFLGGIEIQKDLYANSSVVYAKGIFTFKEKTIDLISVGGSVVAQKGSSGGALIRQSDGNLTGIVVTTTADKQTGDRDLRVITTSYINRALKNQIGMDLETFLNEDVSSIADAFAKDVAPYLKQILLTEIIKN